MTTETNIINETRPNRKAPWHVVIAAWAAPITVLTGWAFVAALPVAIVTWSSWRDPRVRPLRWWATLSTVAYAIPFVMYLSQDNYPSMSKMLDPAMTAFIVAPALVVIAKLWLSHRR